MRKVFAAVVLLAIGILVVLSVRTSPHPPGQVVYEDYKCRDCNLILISVDTLRADRLGTYGHYRNVSPGIDSFAGESVLFEHAFSQAPRTTESHMSMMTSLYPEEHRVTMDLGPYGKEGAQLSPLDKHILTLAQILYSYNYSTNAYTGGGGVHGDYGFKNGFETYDNSFDMMAFINLSNPFAMLKNVTGANKFFLFLHTYKTHSPYLPGWDTRESLCGADNDFIDIAETFNKRVINSVVEHPDSDISKRFAVSVMDSVQQIMYGAPFNEATAFLDTPHYRQMIADLEVLEQTGHSPQTVEEVARFLGTINDTELLFNILSYAVLLCELALPVDGLWNSELAEYFSCLYDGEILEMDRTLTKLLVNIEDNNLSDNTVVIFTSDHGEEFFEHGGFLHGSHFKEHLHVPLIIKNPMQSGHTLRVESPVSLVDIPPTILDILDIPAPPVFRARSLFPAMLGESLSPKQVFSDRYSVVDWPYHLILKNPQLIPVMDQYGGRQDCYEQVLQRGNLLLFNLEDDPLEQNPLLESKTQESMVRLICAHIEEAYEFHNDNPGITSSSPVSEEHLERLRALGYLN